MRVLITGGAGFIGTSLVLHLLQRGDLELFVIDHKPRNPLPTAVRLACCDFRTQSYDGFDAIIHLAAASGVVPSIEDPNVSFTNNVIGSFVLLEQARAADIKKVLVASTAIAADPLSPYAASKKAIEAYCSAFTFSYGMACTSLRFSNVYGPHSWHKKSAVVTFIKNILRNEPVVVYGDGTQARDFLFVGDLVQEIELALRMPKTTGIVKIGSGQRTTLLELIDTLGKVTERAIKIKFEPARRGEIHIAPRGTSVGRPTSLEDGLRETWEWFTYQGRLSSPTGDMPPPRNHPAAVAPV